MRARSGLAHGFACALVASLLAAGLEAPHACAQEAQPRGQLMAPRNERAADASQPPPAAVEHYNRGRELYQAGRYREAVAELEQASALDPSSANLVYNLGRVYELLGEIDLAIKHYERYRDMLPPSEAEEIARVQGALQRLHGARDQVQREPQVRDRVVVRAQPAPKHGRADAAFWSVASTAAAALVAGGVVGALALKTERDVKRFTLDSERDLSERDDMQQRADRLALSSDVLLASGAALGVTSILLYALRLKPSQGASSGLSLQVDTLPGGAALRLRGRL